MPVFRMTRRVRYRECDPMGVVYHTHYVDWFEEARTVALRGLGLPYADLERDGIFMPVVDLAVRYFSPVRYDDLVEVVTTVDDEIPSTRVRFEYEVWKTGMKRASCVAHVTLCFVDAASGRPVRAPQYVKDILAEALSD